MASFEERLTRLSQFVENHTGVVVFIFALLVGGSILVVNVIRDEEIDDWVKVATGVGIAVLVIIASLVTLLVLRGRSSRVEKWTNAFFLLALSVAAGVLPVLLLGRGEQLYGLKLLAIVVLAMVPGFLYLQFLAVRGLTLWEEFVQNLKRLKITEYGELPDADKKPLDQNLYVQKFEAVYGRVVTRTPEGAGPNQAQGNNQPSKGPKRSQGETLVPMLWVTLLVAIGWTLVLQPSSLRDAPLLSDAIDTIPTPDLDARALRFGFIGAYFYVLQMIVRRFFQDDLKADAYINALQRIIGALLVVAVLAVVWPTEGSNTLAAVAFFVGIFPQLGLDLIWDFVKKAGVNKLRPSLRSAYPLSDLDGLNVFYESRFLEEGIEDMQNLATADFVSLMLHTRIPLGRLVDWVDQSQLYLRLPQPTDANARTSPRRRFWRRSRSTTAATGDPPQQPPPEADNSASAPRESARNILRSYGIRNATGLEAAAKPDQSRSALNKALDPTDLGKYRIDMVLATLKAEPNLRHVRAWKRAES